MSKAINEQIARDRILFETLAVRKEGGVLFVEIKSPPMNLLKPELIRDLVSLIRQAEMDLAQLVSDLDDYRTIQADDSVNRLFTQHT